MKDATQIAQTLENRAATRAVITYNDFAVEVDAPPIGENWSNHPLVSIFGDFDREDDELKRPFRTALVYSKVLNRPGEGFFKTLCDLRKLSTPNDVKKYELWNAELNALSKYYLSKVVPK